MQKTVLKEVFELLQQIGIVSSESEFSKDSHTHCSCSKDKDSQTRTTAADDTKRHRTNRLHTYSSTAAVTKSTRRQR